MIITTSSCTGDYLQTTGSSTQTLQAQKKKFGVKDFLLELKREKHSGHLGTSEREFRVYNKLMNSGILANTRMIEIRSSIIGLVARRLSRQLRHLSEASCTGKITMDLCTNDYN